MAAQPAPGLRNDQAIAAYRTLVQHTLPAEAFAGFQLAFLRPFAIPAMADLLLRAGRVTVDAQLRAYRTGLQIYEMIDGGLTSPRARRVISHINRAHAGRLIRPEQYRYVLNAFIVVPTRHMDTFGRRPLSATERAATVAFFADLGRLMAIPRPPVGYSQAAAELDAYERAHVRASASTLMLGRITIDVLRRRLPIPLRPLAPGLFATQLNDPLVTAALGLPDPDPLLARVLRPILRGNSRLAAHRYRDNPFFRPGQPARVFPDGYELEQLMTP